MNISNIQDIVEDDGIIFLTYGGLLSQTLISAMTEALEKEATASSINMGISNNIFTIFIELSQNMMNYSKTKEQDCRALSPGGLIIVSKDANNESYFLDSQNIISVEDKDKVEEKLVEIKTLDREGIKKRYRELRRSGRNTHDKGGGIGFYEIAKRCDNIDYDFKKINDDKFYFHIKTEIKLK